MCLTPIKLKSGDMVPCSRCERCKQRTVSGWAFRLYQESKIAHSGKFLTLTYDTKYLPYTRGMLPTLFKRDLQLFFKRLRKAHGKGHRKIIYYACGEYGDKTKRPHYHIILFNAKLELIDQAWNMGAIHYGNVEPASMLYTMKYKQKQRIGRVKTIPAKYKDRDAPMPFQQSPFALMSKGIGISYVNEKNIRFHMQDIRKNCYTAFNGHKIALPRYYKLKIYTRGELSAIERYQEQLHNEKWEKMSKGLNAKYIDNHLAAVKASFERMYKKASCKTF